MQFVAIDVETANADMGSICQIGLAKFVDGRVAEEWCTLVDPEDYFDEVNISIHGIEPRMVKGQPKLPQIADRLRSTLESTVSVCHTHFDRIALGRAYGRYNLNPIATTWLDSARVVRRTWKDLAWKGTVLPTYAAGSATSSNITMPLKTQRLLALSCLPPCASRSKTSISGAAA